MDEENKKLHERVRDVINHLNEKKLDMILDKLDKILMKLAINGFHNSLPPFKGKKIVIEGWNPFDPEPCSVEECSQENAEEKIEYKIKLLHHLMGDNEIDSAKAIQCLYADEEIRDTDIAKHIAKHLDLLISRFVDKDFNKSWKEWRGIFREFKK